MLQPVSHRLERTVDQQCKQIHDGAGYNKLITITKLIRKPLDPAANNHRLPAVVVVDSAGLLRPLSSCQSCCQRGGCSGRFLFCVAWSGFIVICIGHARLDSSLNKHTHMGEGRHCFCFVFGINLIISSKENKPFRV